MLDGANSSVKVYVTQEKSAYDPIIGFNVNGFAIKPHTAAYFQLRYAEQAMMDATFRMIHT